MPFVPSNYSYSSPGYGLLAFSNPKATETSCEKAEKDRKKYLDKMWAANVLTTERVDYERKANAAAEMLAKCEKEGVLGTSYTKLTAKECDKADKDRKKYLDKMWSAKLLTQERADYERKANAAAELRRKCEKAGVGGRAPGYPAKSIPTLWKSDPRKREIEIGLVASVFLGGPEIMDAVTAATRGWAPTIAIALEWRAEIAGGLLTLQALGEPGYESIDADALSKLVALTLSPEDNAKLLKMAKATGNSDKDLEAAAKKMRSKIAKFGNDAMTYAFAVRGALMVSAGAVAQTLQSTVRTGVSLAVNVIPIFGQIISAGISAVSAVKEAVSKGLADQTRSRMTQLLKEVGPKVAAVGEKKIAAAQEKELLDLQRRQEEAMRRLSPGTTEQEAQGGSTGKTLLWVGAAAAVLIGVVVVVRSRAE